MSKTPIKEFKEALEIFEKYDKGQYPTNCAHDILYFYVNPEDVSEADIIKLEELGFDIHQEYDCFYSYKYGSC